MNIPTLRECDKHDDVILMCEVWDEATYVQHHKKKIAFIFSAMRHFAEELKNNGYNVYYTKLDDPENSKSFTGEIRRVVDTYKPSSICITFPGEYRVLQEIKSWKDKFDLPLSILEDTRFLVTPNEFAIWAEDRKSLRMEFFYREMRKRYKILMKEDKPEGGEWNYDSENRKFPDADRLFIPKNTKFEPDEVSCNVIELVEKEFSHHFGDLNPFYFAVTRQQALIVLENFISERLKSFGDYQDAMVQDEPWMYHSHISFYLNCGLLEPLEVVRRAELAFYSGDAPLNAVEGFIRQIIGWREYIRGIYWLKMPQYKEENFLNANRGLPEFFWGKPTKMNCMSQCIRETKENAYAHHIQRLMVLGNFALLAGLSPKEVNEWYLIVYADAYEWVELPNVSGMILFADGGYLASKPYASSGAYINKMSNYCKSCKYSVSVKTGSDACPFNYLYWNFMMEHESKLRNNPRLGFTYKTLGNMADSQRDKIKSDSERFFEEING